MVDYDAAVAAVQDPNADPILLAKIAYENPEFGANVAVNPRCYPGLKRWIAEFGDERARETLAQYGFTAETFGGPVQDQEAPAQAALQAAGRPPRHRRVRQRGGLPSSSLQTLTPPTSTPQFSPLPTSTQPSPRLTSMRPTSTQPSSPQLKRHSRSLWPPILMASPPNRP